MAAGSMNIPEGFVLEKNEDSPAISIPEGFVLEKETENIPTKGRLAQEIGVPWWAEDAFLGPIAEFARGYGEASASLFGKLDSASRFLGEITGTKSGGMFKEFERSAKQFAESIPETSQNPINKFVFQMGGSALPIAVEFGLARGGNVAKFATIGAIEEYGKEEDPTILTGGKAVIRGATEGAIIGMAIPSAVKAFTKAVDLTMTAGKTAAKNFLTFITGNKAVAKDFVNNPEKYNVNPFTGKVKTTEDIVAENKIIRQQIKDQTDIEKEMFRFKQQRDKQIFDNKLKDSEKKLVAARTEMVQNVESKKKEAVDAIIKKNESAIAESNRVLNEKSTSVFGGALEKYNLLKKEYGENVGLAIEDAQKLKPGFSVPFDIVKNKFDASIKNSPFSVVNGKVQPVTAISSGATDLRQINVLRKEILSKSEDGFTLRYLQDVKRAAHEKASQAHNAGKHELRLFWQDLAKSLDPAKIVEENKGMSLMFPGISKANQEFSVFIKKYDRAMDAFYTKNALGEYVPDVNKGLSAIIKNDKTIMNEMKIADSALPNQDRILPSVASLIQDAERIAIQQKANVKFVKNRFKEEKRAFEKAAKESEERLKKENRFSSLSEKQNSVLKMRDFMSKKNAENAKVEMQLDDAERFYGGLDALRHLKAGGSTGASILQHLLGYGGVLPMLTGVFREAALPSAIGFAAMSPKVASPAIKGLIGVGRTIKRETHKAANVLRRPLSEQIIGRSYKKEQEQD